MTEVSNTTRIDGAIDAYPWLPYLVAYLPPTDGIDSINVVTGSFNAEQGSAGGSAINVTVKSGTNQLHRSVWEYNSIAQFNAQSWSNRTGNRQKNVYNEMGGAIGGPIRRDKLFFFGDYDRNATYVKKMHTMRFGGEYIHAAINHEQPGSGSFATPRGSFVFSGGATTGGGFSITNINSFASFLLGQPENY